MGTRPKRDVRVLLIDADDHARNARAKKLLTAGYQVSALSDTEEAPTVLPPALYDVIVVSVDGIKSVSLDWCKHVGRRIGAGPAVVLLANSPLPLDAAFLPTLVICERTQQQTDEKLGAFLESGIPHDGMGVHHV